MDNNKRNIYLTYNVVKTIIPQWKYKTFYRIEYMKRMLVGRKKLSYDLKKDFVVDLCECYKIELSTKKL